MRKPVLSRRVRDYLICMLVIAILILISMPPSFWARFGWSNV